MPKQLNEHYYQLFVRHLKERMPLYNGAEKRLIPPNRAIELTSLDQGYLPPTVGQLGDYVFFSKTLSKTVADAEVEHIVTTFAGQLANAIETLVEDTFDFGTPVCYDLFRFADGSPNLQVMYVIGDGATLDDPTGSISGWIAYKVSYTVGVRRKNPSLK